ncbi:MAG: endonuclease V [Aigarchaeota archaeon]|nr:endonuclease V [Aigarchaeota archaeon]MDH5702724.1 endonuclease V [Aigarchaeota archaeon]
MLTPEVRYPYSRRPATVPRGFSIRRAARAQILLAARTVEEDVLKEDPELVAGVDVAYDSENGAAAVVVISMKDRCEKESRAFFGRVGFPYIPTFLAFREARFVFAVLRRLETRPDILMVNGHGVAHPRRCGLATHVGVVGKIPCIGVSSSLLKGYTVVLDRGENYVLDEEGKMAAKMIQTPKGPVYVSVGNMISLKRAAKVVTRLIDGGRLPVPMRLAHKAARFLLRESRRSTR